MDFQEKQILFKVRKTVLEMIRDRGIIVPETEDITFEQFNVKHNNNNLDIFINNELSNVKYYIYFHNDIKNFSKADLKSVMSKIIAKYEDESINLILILKEKENSSITKELTKDTYKNVEVFLRKNMVFNITHHTFQPKFSILSKDEEKELIDKYYTTKGKLPKMSKNDPIAKYYGIKSEQIFKIIRKSPEVGESIYYRLVR
jgi:DNA-directed RNA polymerase I, II, and III subunit RPABC1